VSGLSRHGLAGDVRGFYGRLGITLGEHAQAEVAVRCFADPAAHRREDRSPSCSINLRSGAYLCHGCGARGGAYDAALYQGLTPRAAIDLMVDYGLTARRDNTSGTGRVEERRAPSSKRPRIAPSPAGPDVSERRLQRYRDRLAAAPELLSQLWDDRAWATATLLAHDVGWDGARIVIPVREAGRLCAVLRYAPPWRRKGPKMIAVVGSRRVLFPDPALVRDHGELWLVEGPPDALAALSAGIPAVAVPGTHAWNPDWSGRLAGRDVVVCMDCDAPGRSAAARVAADLTGVAHHVRTLDLEPSRHDGYDLTDALLAGRVDALRA
jgi:Toprim domain-containing protein